MTDQINNNDLFNNPMVNAAREAMSEEEKEQYRKIGEQMYGNMNFEDSRYLLNPEAKMSEVRECLESQIRSGLHPSDMNDDEKKILADAYGHEWYKKWGFVNDDLIDMVTVVKE